MWLFVGCVFVAVVFWIQTSHNQPRIIRLTTLDRCQTIAKNACLDDSTLMSRLENEKSISVTRDQALKGQSTLDLYLRTFFEGDNPMTRISIVNSAGRICVVCWNLAGFRAQLADGRNLSDFDPGTAEEDPKSCFVR